MTELMHNLLQRKEFEDAVFGQNWIISFTVAGNLTHFPIVSNCLVKDTMTVKGLHQWKQLDRRRMYCTISMIVTMRQMILLSAAKTVMNQVVNQVMHPLTYAAI